MKPDKVEFLFKSFIANRTEIDTVDGLTGQWNFQVENDDPISDLNAHQALPQCSVVHSLEASGQWVEQGAFIELPSQWSHSPQAEIATAATSVGRQLADLAANFSGSYPDRSHIRFEKSCIVVVPQEQIISISVIRFEAHKDKVTTVKWKTCDKTAFSGTHYVGSSGEIVFEKDAIKKTIQINILHSSCNDKDLRFTVEMSVVDNGFDPKPMTVSLKELADFYEDERQVVNNLPISLPFTVEDIRCILEVCMTSRTFHMALTHLCSAADSVHLEFALAFDLSRICLKKLRRESILKVLQDFFRKAHKTIWRSEHSAKDSEINDLRNKLERRRTCRNVSLNFIIYRKNRCIFLAFIFKDMLQKYNR